MTSKQLSILVALLAASAGAAYYAKAKRNNAATKDSDIVGQPLVKDFSLDLLGGFSVTDTKNSVVIEKKGGVWVVPTREDFPAKGDAVNTLTDNVANLKVLSVNQVDSGDYGRIQVKDPEKGVDEKEAGKAVVLKNTSGGEMATFILGKSGGKKEDDGGMFGMSMGGSGPKPQWVRLKGASDIYEVKEGFITINADPKTWLDTENFLKIEKIKSVAVTGPDASQTYKVFRETENGELKLDGAQPGEEFDGTGKAAGLGSFMSIGQFDDVALAADKDKAGLDKPTSSAVVETFDGYTFTVKVGNKVAPPAPAAGATPDASAPENFYMSFTADGKFVEQRTPPPPDKDGKPTETEEAKKAADEAFAKNLQAQKDKLAKWQALKDRIFIVSKYNLEPITKKRAELMKDKPAPATPAPGSDPASSIVPQISPGGAKGVSASTKPIEVKAVGKGSTTKTPDGKIEAVTPPISVEIPPKDAPKADAPKAAAPKEDAPKPPDK